MPDDPDITINYHKGDPYSTQAHASLGDSKRQNAAKIRLLMLKTDVTVGVTCDEAEIALGMSHQTCSARFSQMKADNELVWVAQRPTRSKRMAGAYTLRRMVERAREDALMPLFTRLRDDDSRGHLPSSED